MPPAAPDALSIHLSLPPPLSRDVAKLIADKDIPQGAATTMYACLAPQLERFSGSYLSDCDVAEPNRAAYDPSGEIRDRLWAVTEEQLRQAYHRTDEAAAAAAPAQAAAK